MHGSALLLLTLLLPSVCAQELSADPERAAEDALDTELRERRSLASGRWGLRPGKRSLASGRWGLRPGKRAVADDEAGRDVLDELRGRLRRTLATGRWGLRPGKRSLASGRWGLRPGKRAPLPTSASDSQLYLLLPPTL